MTSAARRASPSFAATTMAAQPAQPAYPQGINFFLDLARLGQAPAPAPAVEPVAPKEPEKPLDFGTLKDKFKKLKDGHAKEVEQLLGKLATENVELKATNARMKAELEVYRSSTREQVSLDVPHIELS